MVILFSVLKGTCLKCSRRNMASVSSKVVIEDEEVAGPSSREDPGSEEMGNREESQWEPTEFNVQTKKEKRKRKFHTLDEVLKFLENGEEDNERVAKRRLTEEEDDSSSDESCDSDLENLKTNIFDEIMQKQKKLVILRWAEKRREYCFGSTSFAQVKESLTQLREIYEALDS